MLLFLYTTLEEKEKFMIETYFSRPTTIDRLRGGPLGSDLDDLATALQHQGYAWDSIRGYLRGCDQFARWLPQHGYAVADVNQTLVKRYISGLQRPPSGRLPKAAEGLSHLLKLWRQKKRLPEHIDESPHTEADQWLLRYEQYLDQVCGSAASTRRHYLAYVRDTGSCYFEHEHECRTAPPSGDMQETPYPARVPCTTVCVDGLTPSASSSTRSFSMLSPFAWA
jgi:hypothetical protein